MAATIALLPPEADDPKLGLVGPEALVAFN
jgi:hypothetical protein